jgi:hypothetical protein
MAKLEVLFTVYKYVPSIQPQLCHCKLFYLIYINLHNELYT